MGCRYVTADHHFGHHSENRGSVIRYENRPYSNGEEMDADLFQKWNAVVKKSDAVFHLGDVSFHNKADTQSIISRLRGHKILIMGNHDFAHGRQWWLDVGFQEVYRYPIIIDEFYIMSHAPIYLNSSMPYVNIHGHLHSKSMVGAQYVNVSVENTLYAPVSFEAIKKRYAPKLDDVE